MRTVLVLRPSDYLGLPWKNGRGATEQVALWPASARFERGDFDWRVSKAGVDAAGPFSTFPGFERVLVVTHGNGLRLEHGSAAPRVRLLAFEPYRFSGDWSTQAELVDGPVSDFNVITRRGQSSAEVEVLRPCRRQVRERAAAGQVLVHVVSGAVEARITGERQPFELAAADSVWLAEARARDEIELGGATADCVVLLVRISTDRAA